MAWSPGLYWLLSHKIGIITMTALTQTQHNTYQDTEAPYQNVSVHCMSHSVQYYNGLCEHKYLLAKPFFIPTCPHGVIQWIIGIRHHSFSWKDFPERPSLCFTILFNLRDIPHFWQEIDKSGHWPQMPNLACISFTVGVQWTANICACFSKICHLHVDVYWTTWFVSQLDICVMTQGESLVSIPR